MSLKRSSGDCKVWGKKNLDGSARGNWKPTRTHIGVIGTDAPLAGLLRRCTSKGADPQLLSPVLRQELNQALNTLVNWLWAKDRPAA
jgi:hypothetical protein